MVSLLAAILIVSVLRVESEAEQIRIRPMRVTKGSERQLAPLGSFGQPVLVPYFDEALTQRTLCNPAARDTYTIYVVAEKFPAPITSIEYRVYQNSPEMIVSEEVVTGTATGTAADGIRIDFDPPADASQQLLLQRIRVVLECNEGPCERWWPGYFVWFTNLPLHGDNISAVDVNGQQVLAVAEKGYYCTDGMPDLRISSITAPASAILYQDISSLVNFTAENCGTDTMLNSFRMKYYISRDTIITPQDVEVDESIVYPPILAGEGRVVTMMAGSRIPLNAPTGNVYIGAIVDAWQQVYELDETNNRTYRPITIAPDPGIDTTCIYAEDFQEGDGGWIPRDLTAGEEGVNWHQTTYDDGSGARGVVWCGTDDPSYATPPGYGDYWYKELTKAYTFTSSPVTLSYSIQYDSEFDYDFTSVEYSTDNGATFTMIEYLSGPSDGFVTHSFEIEVPPGQPVVIRFSFTSDGAYSDADGQYDSNGACRIDWVQVTGHSRDDFDTGSDGWESNDRPPVGGAFRLVYGPLIHPAVSCEINSPTGKPQRMCNVWAAYDPMSGEFPYASSADSLVRRGVKICIESPEIPIPTDAIHYEVQYDVYSALPIADPNGGEVFYQCDVAAPASGLWHSDPYIRYGMAGWRTEKVDITPFVVPGATTTKIRLIGWQCLIGDNRGPHTPAPFFDNVRVFAMKTAAPGVDISGFPRDCSLSDGDRDGVGNLDDACPAQSSVMFDRDGDGCPAAAISARHIEYLAPDTLAYYIHQMGAAGITDGSDLAAVQQGIDAWGTVPDVEIAMGYKGTTNQKDAQALDGVNLVTFSDPDYVFPAGVLAVGITTSYTEPDHYFKTRPVLPGQIVDCDMIFNPLVQFKTTTAGSGTDLRSVATHEAGHLFGLSHSAVKSSTMFFVLPPDTQAASLELDDRLALFMAYPTNAALAGASRLKGTVTDGRTSAPVPGAIVFATQASTGDTLGCEYTLPDGSFEFAGLPSGDYYVSIYPLNGSSRIGYLQPGNINQLVLDHAATLFVPEYYDAAESATDDPMAKTAVSASAGTTTTVALVTNIDDEGPAVVAMTPAPDETGVKIDASILVSFDEPIDLASVQGDFHLVKSSSGEFMRGNAALVDDDSTLAFMPSFNFDFEEEYKLELGAGISDKFGNSLGSPYEISFTTEVKPDVGITSLAPRKGVEDAVVVISGFGFETNTADNVVDFNGTQAAVAEASATRLLVRVPEGTVTGNVTVTNPVQGKTSNAIQFTMLAGDEVARGYEVGVSHLGSPPRSIAISPDGSIALIGTDAGYSASTVDPGNAQYLLSRAFSVAGGIDELDIAADGKRAYAVSGQNEKLYRINAEMGAGGLNDLVVLNEMTIGAAPRGIVIVPSGKRAYVSTTADEIEVWDINPRSATFDQQVSTITLPGKSLRGKMATDPAGSKLFVLTGAGALLVYDLVGDSLKAEIDVGLDPRDVVVDPAGERAYVTDENGLVTIVSLEMLAKVLDVSTGGTLRGAAVTPAGSFLYAVNRELNFYDVVDLRSESETYRSIAANVPLHVNPVDVEIAPNGLYAYSLSETDQSLVATAIGVGPVLHTVHPVAAPPGARLVIAGSDFISDATIVVSFGGVEVSPDLRRDSMLVVTVPPAAQSGALTVIGKNPFKPDALSNEIYFEVLGGTPAGSSLRLASKLGIGELSLASAAAFSPTGKRGLFATDESGAYKLHVLDTDPTSATFHQAIGETGFGMDFSIDDAVITSDGRYALVIDHGAGASGQPVCIPVVDINPMSGHFAGIVDSIDVSALTDGVSGACVSPNGLACAVAEHGNAGSSTPARLYLFNIDTFGGNSGSGVSSAQIAPGDIDALEYHPAGLVCYLALSHQENAAVHVLDVDPESPAFMNVVGAIALPGAVPKPSPRSIAFTPDGRRSLVLTVNPGTGERTVVMLDTSNPLNPAVSAVEALTASADGVNRIDVSPRGDRAILAYETEGIRYLRIATDPDSLVLAGQTASGLTVAGAGYTPDASRFYAAATAEDSLYVYDFSNAEALAAVSGDGQSGVANRPLQAPLRVRVTGAGGEGASGVVVTFSVTLGGGSFAGSGTAAQVVATDATGAARIDWTLGPDVGTQSVRATAGGLVGSPLDFAAMALVDPATLPLELVDIVPVNSTQDVSVTTALQAIFTRAVDPASVDSMTFYLHVRDTTVMVSALIGFTDGNRKISLTPRAALKPHTTYTLEATAGIHDEVGGALANAWSSSFRTEAPPPLVLSAVNPPSGLRGVNVVISGTGFDATAAYNGVFFNESMAGVTEAGGDHLAVVVPYDALNGSSVLHVRIGESESNALQFNVLAPESISIDKAVITNVNVGSSTRCVAITPDGARLYAVSPHTNSVVCIDIAQFQPLPAIPVGNSPHAIRIHPSGSYAYVTNLLDNTVSVIDIRPASGDYNHVVHSIPVGQSPLDIILTPDGDRLIVSNAGSHDLSIVDADEHSETFHMVLSTVNTGTTTKAMAVTPDGGYLYLATKNGYIVIDIVNFGVTRAVDTGTATKAVAVTPDGAFLILLTSGGSVLIYDIMPGSEMMDQVVGAVTSGTTTKAIAVTPDGGMLYLILERGDAILAIRLSHITSAGVIGSADGGGRTLITTTIVDTLYTGEDPAEITFSPDGSGIAAVTNAGDNTVSIHKPLEIPIAVAIAHFSARSSGRAVILEWKTLIEQNTVGFNVLRSEADDTEFGAITEKLIPARGRAGTYSYTDEAIRPGVRYRYKLIALDRSGGSQAYGPIELTYMARFVLEQNVPNPFNPVTKMRFTVPHADHVRLTIYDVTGRLVCRLIDKRLPADNYEISWDGTNSGGRRVASGVYFCRLEAGKSTATRKMVLLR
jgi:YVTN family beta-propeller protein